MVRIASYGPQIDQSHGENRLSHIIKNFIEDLPGEFTIIIIWQFGTRDTTKVFVFHINQVYLWALKYLNFLSVQTNHSFYTYFINNINCRRAFSEGWSGDVHRLWFLLSEQYQSFVLKIQQFLRVRSLLITLSFQSGFYSGFYSYE